MSTTRLEAFSDGVVAIIITIMVLELKVPAKGVAAMWLVPDRRIEEKIHEEDAPFRGVPAEWIDFQALLFEKPKPVLRV